MVSAGHGVIKNNTNKMAALYRLVDTGVIMSMMYIATLVYAQAYKTEYFVISLIGAVSFAFFAESVSLYRSWRTGDFKEVFFYAALAWGGASFMVLMYLFFSKVSTDYSRIVILIWFVSTFAIFVSWRYVFQQFLYSMRKKGYNTRSIAIFGLSEKGIRLAREVTNNPETGYRINGIYDDRNEERLEKGYHALIEGNIEQGIAAAKNDEYDIIFITLPIQAQSRIQDMLFALGDTTATVHVVPDLFMYCLMHGEMSHIGDIQTISVYDNPMKGGAAIVKRFEDVVFSTIILSIIALPMLAIAIGIKLSSKGPVIFKQHRYGLNGKRIDVWKFRSMTVTENADVVTQATKGDARITKFGAFLRRTSLDELPQFINVLKGDMSVIGPRPHAVSHNEAYRKVVDYYMLRHKVKPGITGWAQVNGWRGETDTVEKMNKRIEFDLEYIRNWSLWLDFKIVLYTVWRGFRDENAY
jgi:putative colanic acid biosynthesis UDP-glucose lipid carrier transferase